MSLIEDELEGLVDRSIVVIMSDGKKFRGKLIRFDSKTLVIEDVLELSDRYQWAKPIIYTTVLRNVTDKPESVDQEDRGYLNEVIINTRHILRVWPWEPRKLD